MQRHEKKVVWGLETSRYTEWQQPTVLGAVKPRGWGQNSHLSLVGLEDERQISSMCLVTLAANTLIWQCYPLGFYFTQIKVETTQISNYWGFLNSVNDTIPIQWFILQLLKKKRRSYMTIFKLILNCTHDLLFFTEERKRIAFLF